MSQRAPRGDWIVVGAGSAGCVVTRRLIDAGHRVTLVEPGPTLEPRLVPDEIDGDNSFAALLPDRVHAGLDARRVAGRIPTPYLRGRGLGGSSAVNAMVGLVGDHDAYRALGIDDVEALVARQLIPLYPAETRELGVVDRALLEADARTTRATLTRRGGRRVTSAEAYLWPVLGSERLDLRTDSLVDLVLVSGRETKGVRLESGDVLTADCVVVCAGAIHSPAILLRSGLELEGLGEGLQDHAAAALLLELRPDAVGSAAGTLGLSTATLVDADPVQILAMNHLGTEPTLGMLMVALMRPTTRSGVVRLRSSDPCQHPDVDLDLLSTPEDLAALRGGVRRALALLEHPSFTSIVERVLIDDVGTTTDDLASDDQIDGWLLARGADYVHASGSCAMGRVVDVNGAVSDVAGLYVCDASVFPVIPNVNTHIPTTLLAEHLVARWVA